MHPIGCILSSNWLQIVEFSPAPMPGNPKIQPRLSPGMFDYLQDLVDVGVYGTNPSDVARSLIEEGIRRAIADGLIHVRRRTTEGPDHVRRTRPETA